VSKPETSFYQALHRHLPRGLYHEKMHNPYHGGTWDVWYSGARDLWVEYKHVLLPVRPATLVPIALSALQLEWGRARYAEGRNLAVIVGCREGGVLLRDLAWEQALTCAAFRARLLTRPALAAALVAATS
jgi:hypothetical protein